MNSVNLFIDKSKNRAGIIEFDGMLKSTLNTILPLNIDFNITHICSSKSAGIQAVDLFCWGIFRKYELNEETWYITFKNKIMYEEKYLK